MQFLLPTADDAPRGPAVLLVGECDFGFACSAARRLGPAAKHMILPTELHSEGKVRCLSRSGAHMAELGRMGVAPVFGVDGTSLDAAAARGAFDAFFACRSEAGVEDAVPAPGAAARFDFIVWNFPSDASCTYGRQLENRSMIRAFLASARTLLTHSGRILLTMTPAQAGHDHWQLHASCRAEGLVVARSMPFSAGDHPGYRSTRGWSYDEAIPVVSDGMTYELRARSE